MYLSAMRQLSPGWAEVICTAVVVPIENTEPVYISSTNNTISITWQSELYADPGGWWGTCRAGLG